MSRALVLAGKEFDPIERAAWRPERLWTARAILSLTRRMPHIVPPKSSAHVVFGRPKTRNAARLSGALGAFAVLTSFLRTENGPVLLLLAAAALAAVVAVVLRVVERPRQFTEYRAPPTLGLPVIHLTGDKSRSDS